MTQMHPIFFQIKRQNIVPNLVKLDWLEFLFQLIYLVLSIVVTNVFFELGPYASVKLQLQQPQACNIPHINAKLANSSVE